MALHVIWNLVVQQLTMRYRRAWLGFAWMLVVPLATMSIMGLALGLVFSVKSTEVLGNIFVCLLPYTLFQGTVLAASNSLVGHQDILRRHSVSRIVFPMTALFVGIVEYLVASASLLALGPLIGLKLTVAAFTIPLGFVCLCTSAIGLGLMGAIGTVYFRDLSHLIQVVLSLLYWVTPIVYTLGMIPEEVRGYFYLNPLVSMLAMYTEPLIYGQTPRLLCLIVAPAVSVVLLVAGIEVFRRNARRVVFYL